MTSTNQYLISSNRTTLLLLVRNWSTQARDYYLSLQHTRKKVSDITQKQKSVWELELTRRRDDVNSCLT